MPSKALLASSDAAYDAREAKHLGIGIERATIDMPFIQARKKQLVQSFAEYRIDGIREFPLYEGTASFNSPHELLITACHPERSEGDACHPERSAEGAKSRDRLVIPSVGSEATEVEGPPLCHPERSERVCHPERSEGDACHPERSERSERSRGSAEDVTLEAKNFIIATGSVVAPALLPGLADTGYLDSDAVLELERIPKSVVVLGGGYTACELGQFFSRMGARVTMVVRSALLSHSDADVTEAVTQAFVEEGIDVIAGARLVRAERRGAEKCVHLEVDGAAREVAAQEIFYALGRVPNTSALNLAAAGVRENGVRGIEIDESLRTSVPHIFAIGDVTAEFLLVHIAIYQGEVAARNAIAGTHEQPDYRTFSAHTIFCDPQVARVGKSEKSLRAAKQAYVAGRYDFADHGKAMCLGKTKGFVKIMADAGSGEILGATAVGTQASELIHEVIVAMHFHATVQEFMRIPHLHPTLAEIWTYPAEMCAEKLGLKAPGDEQIEVATSGTAT